MDKRRETAEGDDDDDDVAALQNLGVVASRPVAQSAHRKWILTQEAFDKLLAHFDEDRERAGERYQELRHRLIRFFGWQGCPFPEDHADETINRVAHKIEKGEEIRDPSGYCFGVARFLVLEIRKEQERERQALRELPSPAPIWDDLDESNPHLDCLRRCLQSLTPDNRELIMQYYWGEKGAKIEKRRSLAERFRVSLNTLRMRALRIRENLEACVDNCLKK